MLYLCCTLCHIYLCDAAQKLVALHRMLPYCQVLAAAMSASKMHAMLGQRVHTVTFAVHSFAGMLQQKYLACVRSSV